MWFGLMFETEDHLLFLIEYRQKIKVNIILILI